MSAQNYTQDTDLARRVAEWQSNIEPQLRDEVVYELHGPNDSDVCIVITSLHCHHSHHTSSVQKL